MLPRRARAWFVAYLAYIAVLSYLGASWCEGRSGRWPVLLVLVGLPLASAAPVLVVRSAVLRDRTSRGRAADRRIGPAVGDCWTLSSLGIVLWIAPLGGSWAWLRGAGLGAAVLGTGTGLWLLVRSLLLGQPPDDGGEVA